MEKKFFFFVALVAIFTGCHAQGNANVAGLTSEQIRYSGGHYDESVAKSEASAKAETQSAPPPTSTVSPTAEPAAPPPAPRVEARREEKVETRSAPPPREEPAPLAPPEPPRTPPVFNAGVPGGPGVPAMLLEGDYQIEEFRSPVHRWTPGWMLRVDNRTSAYQLISSAGAVSIFRMTGQCVDGLTVSRGNCPFVARIDRDSNAPVILLKPGHSAQFVVDQNMCPPNGARCRVKVRAAGYGTTQPRTKRLPRTRNVALYFTGEDRIGQFMAIR